jgi:hypothetical protein
MRKHYCRYGGLFIQVEGGSAHAQERPASESRRQRRNTSNTLARASIERNAHHKAEVRMGDGRRERCHRPYLSASCFRLSVSSWLFNNLTIQVV